MTISIPKVFSGLSADKIANYDFTDIAWFHDQANQFHHKWRYLSGCLAQVGGDFYVNDKYTKRWTKCPDRATAVKTVFQQHGGTVSLGGFPQVLTMDDIKHFSISGVVHLSRTIFAPGKGEFVLFSEQKCLNTYRDTRLAGDDDHVEHAAEFLKIIRGSLCNQDEDRDLGGMFDEIAGDEITPFRWVMHWLAARYQMPGYCPMTHLWLLGKQRGTGKGTLVNAMRGVLGSQAVGKANQADIAKGWTNSLHGHQLIEWDEFKSPGGWREFNNLLKEMTGNAIFTTNERNVGGNVHPNVSMHIFTTNEDRPILVEANDRQNTFISTTSNISWRERANGMWDPISSTWADPKFLSGFAAILNAIDVDVSLISKPLKTDKFIELAEGSSDTVDHWVSEGGSGYPVGEAVPWTDLHMQYRNWVKNHLNAKAEDIKQFKRKFLAGGYASDAPRKVKDGLGGWKSARCAIITTDNFVVDEEENCSKGEIRLFPAQWR